MPNKKTVTLCGIVAIVAFSSGIIIRKSWKARTQYKGRYDKAITQIALIVGDRNEYASTNELQQVYVCERGEIFRRGDSKLSLSECDSWLGKNGYMWSDETLRYVSMKPLNQGYRY